MRKRRYKRKPYKPVNYDTIRETRLLAGLTRQQVADMLRVSLRSVQYWERGLVHMPYAAFRLLRILTGYELPGKEWKNWMLLRNKLISPEGKTFTPGDLYPLNWTIDKARLWIRNTVVVSALGKRHWYRLRYPVMRGAAGCVMTVVCSPPMVWRLRLFTSISLRPWLIGSAGRSLRFRSRSFRGIHHERFVPLGAARSDERSDRAIEQYPEALE